MKTTWLIDNIKPILSIVVLIFGFTYLIYCGVTGVKPDPAITIAVVTNLGIVLNYWFGSSSSSAKKDDTIAAAVNQPTITQTGDKPIANA